MLKAELQKLHDKLAKAYQKECQRATLLEAANDKLEIDLSEAQKSIAKLQVEIGNLRDKNELLAEAEHAIRCVRLPHVELENEHLEKQANSFANECLRMKTQYRDLLRAFRDAISQGLRGDLKDPAPWEHGE